MTESDPVNVRLKDGTSVVQREVHPEDRPLLQETLKSSSPTSLYHHFQYVTKRTREIASRFCHIVDGSEKAIVAEIGLGGMKQLIGTVLTDYCLDLAHRWGVEEIVAVTTPDNRRVIEMGKSVASGLSWSRELLC